MDNSYTIDIISPVRNREWILPYFLKHIYNLDYQKDKIRILFCLNDSEDNSNQILEQFKQTYQKEYKDIKIYTYNLNAIIDERYAETRKKIYITLPKVRNFLLSHIKSDYVFSIDSDILCESDTLKRLLDAKKDVVSSIIYNGYEYDSKIPWRFTNVMNKDINGQYFHIGKRYRLKKRHIDDIVQVNMTGAVYLILKEVAQKCKYGYHDKGEDFAFCDNLYSKGFKAYCNLNLYSQHIMGKKWLEKYLNGELELKEKNDEL